MIKFLGPKVADKPTAIDAVRLELEIKFVLSVVIPAPKSAFAPP